MTVAADAPAGLKVVVVAGLKGGCGKTTLTALLAVHAAQAGHRVAIMDTDPQQGLTNWFERREARSPVNAEGQRQRQSGATGKKPIGDQRQPIIGVRRHPFRHGEGQNGKEERSRGPEDQPCSALFRPQ